MGEWRSLCSEKQAQQPVDAVGGRLSAGRLRNCPTIVRYSRPLKCA